MSNLFIEHFKDHPATLSIYDEKSALAGISLQEEALFITSAYVKKPRQIVIIKQNLYQAQQLFERLSLYLKDEVLLYGVEESLRVEAIAASPERKAQELETLDQLRTSDSWVCVTHSIAMIRYLPSPDVFHRLSIYVKEDQEVSFEQLKQHLFYAGYEHVSRVDQPLCYAARGGIIDVFSINFEHPLRIEFFDNTIESIRFFDIVSQRTIEVIKEATIIPATDILFSEDERAEIIKKGRALLLKNKKQNDELLETAELDFERIDQHLPEPYLYKYFSLLEKKSTLIDYMKYPLIITSSEEMISQSIYRVHEETTQYMEELYQMNQSLPLFELYQDFNSIIREHHVDIGAFPNKLHHIQTDMRSIHIPYEGLGFILEQTIKDASQKKIVFCLDKKEQEQVIQWLVDHDYIYHHVKEYDDISKGVQFSDVVMYEGFESIKDNLLVYTSKELFHQTSRPMRYKNKFREAQVLNDYMELEIGDYVVHNQHGVGKYLGIETRDVNGIHKDFLKVSYRGDDILFVPLEQFHLIRKFLSKEGVSPKLNKLGGSEWERTKANIKENVAELAERLISLYSVREEDVGFAFSKDTPYQIDFEADFDYELTADQVRAVKEIKKDMEINKPMDRLLCGDVGYGKTEVAARAAFKAVMDNKQVAFLCPTTILSAQHHRTFIDRFANFPIRIEVLNRFVSIKDQHRILLDVKDGKVDILIGTHRILSKDVVFKDLGFLVIDEEQRFGVEHKEKIKEFKHTVDVVSLSATPIPRTLQMSLIGIRSLSQLDTPPRNRMPVQTYVIEKNEHIIKEIIERELSRDGQIFYLYNKVKDIYQVAARLQSLFKDTLVGVAHGQMSKEDIEDVMIRFTNKEYKILVCTTIIETGIDIPNANTMIVESADMFGLSQLYQIKGRVGRSDRVAYAYLMYSAKKQLSEIAMKRLNSIKEFTQLGSGYKIAMRDLTIRGAGDMLGKDQAGFIDTIGIDMYIEMLHEAIALKKGEKPKEEEVILHSNNVQVDAYIPQNFAPQDLEKIKLYQRLDEISNLKELIAMFEEIRDNYGRLPKAVQLLFEKKRLDILTNEPHIESFKEHKNEVEIVFNKSWSSTINGVQLFESVNNISKDIRLKYSNEQVTMRLTKTKNWLSMIIHLLEQTNEIVV